MKFILLFLFIGMMICLYDGPFMYTHMYRFIHRVEVLSRIDDGGLSVVNSKQSPSDKCGVMRRRSMENGFGFSLLYTKLYANDGK